MKNPYNFSVQLFNNCHPNLLSQFYRSQLLAFLAILLFFSCTNDDPQEITATVVSTEVSEITFKTANFTGEITSNGGSKIITKGVCWAAEQNPTIESSKTVEGTGMGSFTSTLTGLLPATTYYIRAYAINSVGVSYGKEIVFTTRDAPIELPVITSKELSDISFETAKSGGNITNDGGSAITKKGVCWSTTNVPTILNAKTEDGTGVATFTSSLTALQANTTYYLRAYATNIAGTAYGEEIEFTTLEIQVELPTLTSTAITEIQGKTAKSGGNISDNGGATITSKGVCWSTSPLPTLLNTKTTEGTGIGSFTSTLTGMTLNTTYYLRAYATNSKGTAYGEEIEFTTTSENIFNGDVYLKNQQEVNNFGSFGYTKITGDLLIEPTIPIAFSNLAGLSSLTSIGGAFYLSKTIGLHDLSDLNNLVSIGSDLSLSYNQGLTTLGLEKLTTVSGNIKITLNDDLENLNGLEQLVANGGKPNLTIWSNEKLDNFCGIKPLLSNFNGILSMLRNLYNPTQQEIVNGDCSQ
jgi:hypothetical protein